MGANIRKRASFLAFIREVDLAKIRNGTSLQVQVHCRKFGIRTQRKDTPSLRFLRTTIGQDCTVKGMVYLGPFFGDTSTVEKLSIITEGVIVPDRSYVAGNPAFVIKEADRCEVKRSCLLGLLKVLWLGFELHLLERCC